MALSIAVLRNLDFRRLLLARVFGMFGLQAQAVIVGWQIYTLTNDVFMLGLVGLVEAVPAIGFALFAGHIVDISRPHRVYCLAFAALALNAFALLAVGGGLVPLAGAHQVWIIFACVFFSGAARSFIMPSSFTLLSVIVARSNLPAASAWMSSGFQLAAILGPAMAGIIYGGYGATVAWTIPAIFLALGFLMAISIGNPHRHYKSGERREPAIASIKAGWKFILGNRVMLSVMSLDMFAVLFGGAVAILPAFADSVLHVGSEGLGLLRAAPAIGSIVMALFLALKPFEVIRARTLLYVVVGFGLCIIGFGLSHSLWVAAVFLLLSGVFDSVSMVIRGTLMQLLIPENMRGRVSSVNSMFITSSNEIGAFRAGVMGSAIGLVPSILVGGVMTLMVVGVTAVAAPQMRRLAIRADDHSHEKKQA